jgi:hypothetical protein
MMFQWDSGLNHGLGLPQATGSECVHQNKGGKDKVYRALSIVPSDSYALRG